MRRQPFRPAPRTVLAVLVALWLAVVAGSHIAIPRMIAAAREGKSFGWLQDKLKSHEAFLARSGVETSPEYFDNWARKSAWKATALVTLFAGATAAAIASPALRRRFKRFLVASSAPLNLAVLRVAAFGMVLYLLHSQPIEYYASWPREMYQWPLLAKALYAWLPISPEVVSPLLAVAKYVAWFAMLGLATRVTAPLAVLLGVYLIGIPQLSGKVDHLHHVLLISAVLACSRCADALSIDSIWRAIRRADQGVIAPPRRRVAYGLPIRVSMLILVTVYFFPGFWKLASNGPQWVFSDNLHNHMLHKWFELEHYTPPIPIHELPFSGQGGALFALVFELGFPFALLFNGARPLWGAMGLVFHNLTNLLMKISFVTLQTMYVMFVDWQRLLHWLGRSAYGSPIRVLYDGNCGLCRRTLGVLGSLDWLGQLKPANALNRAAVEAEGLEFLDEQALVTDMHAAWEAPEIEWGVAQGYAAYQAIAWRVPLLWPLLPVLYFPPVAAVGRWVYRRVADSRACRLPSVAKPGIQAAGLAWSWKPLALLGATILAGQFLLGAGRMHHAWPLACYPLFDQIEDRTLLWPEFEAQLTSGEKLPLDDDPLRDKLGVSRFVASMHALLEKHLNEERADKVLARFGEAWRDAGALPKDESQIAKLVLTRNTYELTGPARPETPTKVEPLAERDWSVIAEAK